MSYDADFFGWQAEGSASSAAVVVPLINELVHPVSVLDVGCGTGQWLTAWAHNGACVLAGVDGDWVQPLLSKPMQQLYRPHDLTQPLDMGRRFDLALCLEVAEHLPAKAARTLVASLCAHADVVAFSAAVPGQGGVGHVNEHWPSYWAKLFAHHGYQPYDLLREAIWWDQRVEWWYRQNMIVFATDKAATRYALRVSRNGTALDLAQPALLCPELASRIAATVCIPWRPSPSRLAPFQRVKEFWAMFGWPVITGDSDTEVFSLAQARNNAVKKATTDVVIIADADTLIDPLNVLRAAADPQGVCWPFTRYRILDPKYLDTPISELAGCPYINTWDGEGVMGVGGCMVTTRKEYWRLGGQPPEFVGWGWEDTAFTMIVGTLSTVGRLAGHAYAFEHNSHAETYTGAKADSPGWDRDYERNQSLIHPYRIAQGRAWLMREMLRQRPMGVSS